MLVARQSFTYVDSFDLQKKSVHRGRTRVAESHELVRRYPHRWEPVNLREDARSRFRDQLDRVETYDEYVRLLDKATARLERTERRGEVRVTAPRPGGRRRHRETCVAHASRSSRSRANRENRDAVRQEPHCTSDCPP